jgi:hypothetical protein
MYNVVQQGNTATPGNITKKNKRNKAKKKLNLSGLPEEERREEKGQTNEQASEQAQPKETKLQQLQASQQAETKTAETKSAETVTGNSIDLAPGRLPKVTNLATKIPKAELEKHAWVRSRGMKDKEDALLKGGRKTRAREKYNSHNTNSESESDMTEGGHNSFRNDDSFRNATRGGKPVWTVETPTISVQILLHLKRIPINIK